MTTMFTNSIRKLACKLALALLVTAGAAGAVASPALAADWHHAAQWRNHGRREHHPVVYAPAPVPYPYAAPVTGYYAPVVQPAVTLAVPGLALSFTLPQ
ncbi:MAG TPA: hypothetical protein VN802_17485 [Stellaceae bacterium]|nr:hypothetical protein [Stellaceae bacterium]